MARDSKYCYNPPILSLHACLMETLLCRKRLDKLPADASGLQAFQDAIGLISRNAHTFASVLNEEDLKHSATLFEEKADAVYRQGVREIESYGNSAMRGQ